MEGHINFQFENETYTANYVICQKQDPTYIYVFFESENLKKEFGEEVCMHTQDNKLLESNIYSDRRLELFSELFLQVMKLHSMKEQTTLNNTPS